MLFQHRNDGWVIHTPAKINLALEVLSRMPDGFHQVETVLMPIGLWDTLYYQPTRNPFRLRIVGTPDGDHAELSENLEKNLVTQAVDLIASQTGRSPTGELTLYKRIPSQAGLGGGSSDAAAALSLMNNAWDLGFSKQRLMQLARQLGTDVPFFLEGGAALGTGRGEQLAAIESPAGMPLVIAKPATGLSTPQVFGELGLALGEAAGNITHRCQRIVEHLQQRTSIATWAHLVHNSLQSTAVKLSNAIQQLVKVFKHLPVLAHQMTGSGSGYFGICRNLKEAKHIAARLRAKQHWAIATLTCY